MRFFMKYGLSEEQFSELVNFLAKYSQIEKAVLFGSRVLGSFKKYSDIDIAIMGKDVDFWLAAHTKYELEEETNLPYFFDIIAYDSIDNLALKEHIQQYGQPIYTKD
jgi:predicted nucleotidyltransferase